MKLQYVILIGFMLTAIIHLNAVMNLLNSMNCMKFLGQLSYYQLLKKNPAPLG
jgi:hypothetical protein